MFFLSSKNKDERNVLKMDEGKLLYLFFPFGEQLLQYIKIMILRLPKFKLSKTGEF